MSNIDHGDLADLNRNIDGATVTVTPRLHGVVDHRTGATARAIADAAPVRTGRLKRGIGSTTDGLTGLVTSEADYWSFVDQGTSEMGPQPFVRPGLDRQTPRLVDDVADLGESFL